MFAPTYRDEGAAAQAQYWGQQTAVPTLQVPRAAPLLPDGDLLGILQRFEEVAAEHRDLGRQLNSDRRIEQARARDRADAGAAIADGKQPPEPTHEPKALEAVAADQRRRAELRAALDQLDRRAADLLEARGDTIRQQLDREAGGHLDAAVQALAEVTDHLEAAHARRGLSNWTWRRRGHKARQPTVELAGTTLSVDKVVAAVARALQAHPGDPTRQVDGQAEA